MGTQQISFDLDAARFYNFSPFDDFAAHDGAKCLGAVADRLRALIGQAIPDALVFKDVPYRLNEELLNSTAMRYPRLTPSSFPTM